MKILVLFDNSGPKYWRLLLPVFLMPEAEITVSNILTEEHAKDCDILFFNRVISNIRLQTVLDWREKYGFKMVVDFDDHWRLGPDHLLYDTYKHFSATEVMEEYIKVSDCVFVTHERLRNEVLPFNKKVHVLPNAIPRWGQFLCTKTESEYIRMFWAGGVTHKKDIQLLAGPVKRINNDKLQWVMGGYVRGNTEWQSMASAFTSGGRFRNKLIEALPVDSYYYTYSECEISLVPLLETRFNSFKSNLKVLEAANIGSPVVVSHVHPYLDLEHVGYVYSQGDWYLETKRLIRDKVYRKEQGLKLKEWCFERYNFEKINTERKQILEWVKKTELSLSH